MYKYSLSSFKRLVLKTFETPKVYKYIEEKMEIIEYELMSVIVFYNVQMSLYSHHKIIFPFLLALKLDQVDKK